jgi:hypothetical protein
VQLADFERIEGIGIKSVNEASDLLLESSCGAEGPGIAARSGEEQKLARI